MAALHRFTLQEMKIQASAIAPPTLKHTDGLQFPLEYFQFEGDSITGIPQGIFVEIPFQSVTGTPSITVTVDWFPTTTPPGSVAAALSGAMSYTATGTTNLFTKTFATAITPVAVTLTALGQHKQTVLTFTTGPQQDSALVGGRIALKLFRDPAAAADTYQDGIGIFGLTVGYP